VKSGRAQPGRAGAPALADRVDIADLYGQYVSFTMRAK